MNSVVVESFFVLVFNNIVDIIDSRVCVIIKEVVFRTKRTFHFVRKILLFLVNFKGLIPTYNNRYTIFMIK